jgi:hypothetical protein
VSVFKSEKFIPGPGIELELVANELADHFRELRYVVERNQLSDTRWEVGITRGGVFRKAVGLQSALKIQLEGTPTGTTVKAGAGIFGKQAIPTALTLLVAWPVVLAQVWGIIREAGLDDEAVRVVETSIARYKRFNSAPQDGGQAGAAPFSTSVTDHNQPKSHAMPQVASSRRSTPAASYCSSCGNRKDYGARFCGTCGQSLVPSR